MEIFRVIGIMSGTSLDGVDLAFCEFTLQKEWDFKILHAETIDYTEEWSKRLAGLMNESAECLIKTHVDYGKYLGHVVADFISRNHLKPDFISSHGHTIFHQPHKSYTLQIGDGNVIASITGLPVIYDFRSLDIALGGQGAPLVPIGDRLLFGQFGYCLNLGGISNVSFELNDKRIAYDICPVNIVLNKLSGEKGLSFDKNGRMAASGKLVSPLLEKLNSLEYYNLSPPKSLGREWINAVVFPVLQQDDYLIEDKLRTFSEHIAIQIGNNLNQYPQGKLLITGGGAKNKFLTGRISAMVNHDVIIPDNLIIDYKEAMIFAFLGVLRWRNEINCLSSVTGAMRDCSSGIIVNG